MVDNCTIFPKNQSHFVKKWERLQKSDQEGIIEIRNKVGLALLKDNLSDAFISDLQVEDANKVKGILARNSNNSINTNEISLHRNFVKSSNSGNDFVDRMPRKRRCQTCYHIITENDPDHGGSKKLIACRKCPSIHYKPTQSTWF